MITDGGGYYQTKTNMVHEVGLNRWYVITIEQNCLWVTIMGKLLCLSDDEIESCTDEADGITRHALTLSGVNSTLWHNYNLY